MRSKKVLRALSFVLLQTFLAREMAFAEGLVPLLKEGLEPKPSVSIQFPAPVATIEDAYETIDDRLETKDKLFYLIQDAHTNESGQYNLSKTLSIILDKEKDLKYVFTEAGAGDNSLSSLRNQNSKKEIEGIARSYIKKGYLHGAEYLDLTSEQDFTLWGVEDLGLYSKALEDYRQVAKERDRLDLYLKKITSTAETLKNRLLNPELATFDKERNQYREEKLPLTSYFTVLLRESQLQNIPLSKYTHLQLLQSLRDKEAAIDFAKANNEHQEAVRALSPEAQEELKSLADTHSRADKVLGQGQKETQAYFLALEEVLNAPRSPLFIKEGGGRGELPELLKYFEYLKLAKTVEAKEVLKEVDSLEKDILSQLIRTEDERLLIKTGDVLFYLNKLFRFTLTPEEFDAYKKLTGVTASEAKQSEIASSTSSPRNDALRRFSIEHLTGFLNKKIMELGAYYERTLFLETGYDDILKRAESFYEITKDRDEHFLKVALEKLDKERSSKAVLITGGFHTTNLKALLKAKGISYVSITPQVWQETNLKKYESVLLGQNLSLLPAVSRPNTSTIGVLSARTPGLWGEKLIGDIRGIERAPIPLQSGARLAQDTWEKAIQPYIEGVKIGDGSVTIALARPEDLDGIMKAQRNSASSEDIRQDEAAYEKLIKNSQLLVARAEVLKVGDETTRERVIGSVAFFVTRRGKIRIYAEALNPENHNPSEDTMYDPWIAVGTFKRPGGVSISDALLDNSHEIAKNAGKALMAFSRPGDAHKYLSEGEKSRLEELRTSSNKEAYEAFRGKLVARHILLMRPRNQRNQTPSAELFIKWVSENYHNDELDQKLSQVVLADSEDKERWNPSKDKKFVQLLGLLVRKYLNEHKEEEILPVDPALGGLHSRRGAWMADIFVGDKEGRPDDTDALGANVIMSYEKIADIDAEIQKLLPGARLANGDDTIIQLSEKNVSEITEKIRFAYDAYYIADEAIASKALQRFTKREWVEANEDQKERVLLYSAHLKEIRKEVQRELASHPLDLETLRRLREDFWKKVDADYDADLARTFFYSVIRGILFQKAEPETAEFNDDGIQIPIFRSPNAEHPYAEYKGSEQTLEQIMHSVLRNLPFVLTPDADKRAESAASARLRARFGEEEIQNGTLQFISNVFFRNKGAYLIGRFITASNEVRPVVLSFGNHEKGITLHAMLTNERFVHDIFASSRSNFRVPDIRQDYREMIDFLWSILPTRDRSEIYAAVGFIQPSKVGFLQKMRSVLKPGVVFEEAPGREGTVMIVMRPVQTKGRHRMEEFKYVFKIIRDASEKFDGSNPWALVTEQYRKAHSMDRVGRKLDAMHFSEIDFPAENFSTSLLEKFNREFGSIKDTNVRVQKDEQGKIIRITFKDLYVQREVTPLDVFFSDPTRSKEEKMAAKVDLVRCISDLAVAGVYMGDMKINNFGITPNGRVVSFDHDDMIDLTKVGFMDMDVEVRRRAYDRDNPEDKIQIMKARYKDMDFIKNDPRYVAYKVTDMDHIVIPEYQMMYLRGVIGASLFDELFGELQNASYWNDIKTSLILDKNDRSFYPYPASEKMTLEAGTTTEEIARLSLEEKLAKFAQGLRIRLSEKGDAIENIEDVQSSVRGALASYRGILDGLGIPWEEAEKVRAQVNEAKGGYEKLYILFEEWDAQKKAYSEEGQTRLVRDKTLDRRIEEAKAAGRRAPSYDPARNLRQKGRYLTLKLQEEVTDFLNTVKSGANKESVLDRGANVYDVLTALQRLTLRDLTHTVVLFPPASNPVANAGQDLYEKYDYVRDIYARVNTVARSVFKETDPSFDARTTETTVGTHVASLAYEMALWEVYKREALQGTQPDSLMGISRGAIAAFYASGAINLELAVELMIKKMQFLEKASEKAGERRMAVVWIAEDALLPVLAAHKGIVSIKINDKQFIISAPTSDLGTIESEVKQVPHTRFMPSVLKVASHDPNLVFVNGVDGEKTKDAQDFDVYLEGSVAGRMTAPQIPLYSSVTGERLVTVKDLVEEAMRFPHERILLNKTLPAFQSARGVSDFVMMGGPDFILPSQKKSGLLKEDISSTAVFSDADILSFASGASPKPGRGARLAEWEVLDDSLLKAPVKVMALDWMGTLFDYSENYFDPKPMAGAIKLIEQIKEKGLKATIVTNMPSDRVEAKLNEHGIIVGEDGLVAEIFDSSEDQPYKDKSESLRALARSYNIDPGQIVMIGDSDTDVIDAREAGVPSIALASETRGNEEELKAEKPSAIVTKFDGFSPEVRKNIFDFILGEKSLSGARLAGALPRLVPSVPGDRSLEEVIHEKWFEAARQGESFEVYKVRTYSNHNEMSMEVFLRSNDRNYESTFRLTQQGDRVDITDLGNVTKRVADEQVTRELFRSILAWLKNAQGFSRAHLFFSEDNKTLLADLLSSLESPDVKASWLERGPYFEVDLTRLELGDLTQNPMEPVNPAVSETFEDEAFWRKSPKISTEEDFVALAKGLREWLAAKKYPDLPVIDAYLEHLSKKGGVRFTKELWLIRSTYENDRIVTVINLDDFNNILAQTRRLRSRSQFVMMVASMIVAEAWASQAVELAQKENWGGLDTLKDLNEEEPLEEILAHKGEIEKAVVYQVLPSYFQIQNAANFISWATRSGHYDPLEAKESLAQGVDEAYHKLYNAWSEVFDERNKEMMFFHRAFVPIYQVRIISRIDQRYSHYKNALDTTGIGHIWDLYKVLSGLRFKAPRGDSAIRNKLSNPLFLKYNSTIIEPFLLRVIESLPSASSAGSQDTFGPIHSFQEQLRLIKNNPAFARRHVQRVLVNEDYPSIAMLYEELLKDAFGPDVQITKAINSETAWDLFQSKKFDLVLTDQDTKSAMTGDQLITNILQTTPLDKRPFILWISGRNSEHLAALAQKDGFEPVSANTAVLTKPFDESQLLELFQLLKAQGARLSFDARHQPAPLAQDSLRASLESYIGSSEARLNFFNTFETVESIESKLLQDNDGSEKHEAAKVKAGKLKTNLLMILKNRNRSNLANVKKNLWLLSTEIRQLSSYTDKAESLQGAINKLPKFLPAIAMPKKPSSKTSTRGARLAVDEAGWIDPENRDKFKEALGLSQWQSHRSIDENVLTVISRFTKIPDKILALSLAFQMVKSETDNKAMISQVTDAFIQQIALTRDPDLLIRILRNESLDKKIYGSVFQTLSNNQRDDALIRILKDKGISRRNRQLAALNLGSLGRTHTSNDRAQNALIKVLYEKDEDYRLRRYAALALGQIAPSNPTIREVLIRALKNEGIFLGIGLAAAESLGYLPPDPLIEKALITTLRDNTVFIGIHIAAIHSLKLAYYQKFLELEGELTVGSDGDPRKERLLQYLYSLLPGTETDAQSRPDLSEERQSVVAKPDASGARLAGVVLPSYLPNKLMDIQAYLDEVQASQSATQIADLKARIQTHQASLPDTWRKVAMLVALLDESAKLLEVRGTDRPAKALSQKLRRLMFKKHMDLLASNYHFISNFRDTDSRTLLIYANYADHYETKIQNIILRQAENLKPTPISVSNDILAVVDDLREMGADYEILASKLEIVAEEIRVSQAPDEVRLVLLHHAGTLFIKGETLLGQELMQIANSTPLIRAFPSRGARLSGSTGSPQALRPNPSDLARGAAEHELFRAAVQDSTWERSLETFLARSSFALGSEFRGSKDEKVLTIRLNEATLLRLGLRFDRSTSKLTVVDKNTQETTVIDVGDVKETPQGMAGNISLADAKLMEDQARSAIVGELGALIDINTNEKVMVWEQASRIGQPGVSPALAKFAANALYYVQKRRDANVRFGVKGLKYEIIRPSLEKLEIDNRLKPGTLTSLFDPKGFDAEKFVYITSPDSPEKKSRNIVVKTGADADLTLAAVFGRLEDSELKRDEFVNAFKTRFAHNTDFDINTFVKVLTGKETSVAIRELYALLPVIEIIDWQMGARLAALQLRTTGSAA